MKEEAPKNGKVFFISGIDTGIGKTYATAILARSYMQAGKSVITQKMVQTGCRGMSEDIILHRELMGIEPLPADVKGVTCPYVFNYPASPHLAAEMEGHEIHIELINSVTEALLNKYDVVLLEGAGGLMAPVTRRILTIDYIAMFELPVVLVTSGRLGSLNHTLLCLDVCRNRGLTVHTIIYNAFPVEDEQIQNDSFSFLEDYLSKHFPATRLLLMPEVKSGEWFTFNLCEGC